MAACVFMSYSHKGETLRDELEIQLAILKRQGLIEVWHDRRLLPGDHLDWTISKELDRANIVRLLVSPDFLASDYCYKIEKSRALRRHQKGTARLISVILRPCDWKNTNLKNYLVTPKDGCPVTTWPNRDEALLDVAKSIRRAIEEIGTTDDSKLVRNFMEKQTEQSAPSKFPRSSNLRLRKEFTEADKDRFLESAFDYIDKFFQGSLAELKVRTEGIETHYRKVDGNTFTAAIYRNGTKVAACSIRLGGMLGNSIFYSNSDVAPANSYNESISVENDDLKLFLRPIGMPYFSVNQGNDSLSKAGAADYYWGLLIGPLQDSYT